MSGRLSGGGNPPVKAKVKPGMRNEISRNSEKVRLQIAPNDESVQFGFFVVALGVDGEHRRKARRSLHFPYRIISDVNAFLSR
jgi:hypothetical protein